MAQQVPGISTSIPVASNVPAGIKKPRVFHTISISETVLFIIIFIIIFYV